MRYDVLRLLTVCWFGCLGLFGFVFDICVAELLGLCDLVVFGVGLLCLACWLLVIDIGDVVILFVVVCCYNYLLFATCNSIALFCIVLFCVYIIFGADWLLAV